MKTIVHIITGLNMGGAEAMLFKLIQRMDKQKYKLIVISMLDDGVYGKKIRELGVEVYALKINNYKTAIKAIFRTIKICETADIIQCWMYHANLFGFVVNFFSKKKLIWGIRRGELLPKKDKRATLIIAKLSALVSKKVDKIVYCAEKSKLFHEGIGYSAKKSIVIPNGFELNRFYKTSERRESFRIKTNIPENNIVVAFVGRFSNVKGYSEFIKACGIVKKNYVLNNITIICAGKNVNYSNIELVQEIERSGLKDSVLLLDERTDIPEILSASDLFVSASFTEAFSNAIGEAMASSLPCIATDVGDNGYIIGDAGIIVDNNSPQLLAKAILTILNMQKEDRLHIGEEARFRVEKLFDITKIVKDYELLYGGI